MKRFQQRLIAWIAGVGADSSDDDETRLQKTLLVGSSSFIGAAALLWGFLYAAYSEPLAASIPLSYFAASSISVVVFARTRRYGFFRFGQLVLILLLPFLLMLVLGGFVNSSGVILWSLLCPLGALLFSEPRHVSRWLLAYLSLLIASWLLQPYVRVDNNLSSGIVTAFFVLNIGGPSLVAVILLQYFAGQKNSALGLLHIEQEKSERLLLNVLPADIAAILKNENRTIADHFDAVSVLFADIVGSTPLAIALAPIELVNVLNEVFSYYDSLAEKYDVEKIRTMGDSYMVASGVPRTRPDHAHALAAMALDMNSYICNRASSVGVPLQFRIGMNSGPVVAGVIGQKKFHYDIWGDTVNTASRMESHGVPGKIQITQATYELIKDGFVCTPRGMIDVKGIGEMETWFLESVRS